MVLLVHAVRDKLLLVLGRQLGEAAKGKLLHLNKRRLEALGVVALVSIRKRQPD